MVEWFSAGDPEVTGVRDVARRVTRQGVMGTLFPSLVSLVRYFEFVVRSTFFVDGGNVFAQLIGLPMGTNCAVFVANTYLFMYELAFICRTVAAGDTARLADIRFTSRYLDDCFSARSFFAGLRYDIYPQQLRGKSFTLLVYSYL